MAYVSLASDYQEGCHPVVMARLAEEAAHQNAGYGTDEVCTVCSTSTQVRSLGESV